MSVQADVTIVDLMGKINPKGCGNESVHTPHYIEVTGAAPDPRGGKRDIGKICRGCHGVEENGAELIIVAQEAYDPYIGLHYLSAKCIQIS